MLITNYDNINVWIFSNNTEIVIASTLGYALFIIGVFGIVFTRKNILVVLMAIEIMLLGVSLLFITVSTFLETPDGYIFAIFILIVAAVEAAVGLGILVAYNRLTRNILLSEINVLRG